MRKKSNALKLLFLDGPGGRPFATATQNGADGRGSKVATLFGFKNGGVGTHLLEVADGEALHVKSGSSVPTEVTTAAGATVATIERGEESSIARAAGGTEIMRFLPHPDGCKNLERYRLIVTEPGPDGTTLGGLDVIRTMSGWGFVSEILWGTYLWDEVGAPLKLPFLGSWTSTERAVSDVERNVLLAACTDIVIGLRPYVKDMR